MRELVGIIQLVLSLTVPGGAAPDEAIWASTLSVLEARLSAMEAKGAMVARDEDLLVDLASGFEREILESVTPIREAHNPSGPPAVGSYLSSTARASASRIWTRES